MDRHEIGGDSNRSNACRSIAQKGEYTLHDFYWNLAITYVTDESLKIFKLKNKLSLAGIKIHVILSEYFIQSCVKYVLSQWICTY